MNLKKTFILFLVLVITLPLAANVYEIIPVTDSASESLLNKGYVMWKDSTTAKNLYLYNGTRTIQLSDNSNFESLSIGDLDNGQAVWTESNQTDATIFYYDGQTTRTIGGNGGAKYFFKLDNGQFVWQSRAITGEGNDILFYDGETIQRLTDIGSYYYNPCIDNGEVVWSDRTDIFLYSGHNIRKIKIGGQNLLIEDFDQGQILYTARVNNATELFIYDSNRITQVTNNTSNHTIAYPNLENGKVAYTYYSNETWSPPGSYRTVPLYNLYLYDNGNTIQLSSRCVYNIKTDGFDGDNLVWVELAANNSKAVYLYDGQTSRKISGDSSLIHSPVTDNGQILWQEYLRILLATPVPNLTLEYKNTQTQNISMWIEAGIRLINPGESAVQLDKIAIKYWFTDETYPDSSIHQIHLLMNESTYSVIGQWPYSSVTGQRNMLSMQAGGAAYYEFGFTQEAGLIPPASSVLMIVGIHSGNWNLYNQSNDYSFNPAATSYILWDKITLYYDGQLVWGSEPL